MQVRKLIEMLAEASNDAIVMQFDGDAGRLVPITGMTHNSQEVEFHTDVDGEEGECD